MFIDYMIVPIICTIYGGITAHHILPMVPLWIWFLFFVAGFTLLNVKGIKVTSRANWTLMIVMSVVVFWLMAAAIRYILEKKGIGGLLTIEPFYHSETFSIPVIGKGTALAALTYIGFDGLTTLSEEVANPRRNVLLATVLTCVITGIWSTSQIYLAQACVPWSEWPRFIRDLAADLGTGNELERAIIGVANLVGGHSLEIVLTVILLVGSVGSGITGQAGAARVMYGMGRDRMLPNKFFGHLDKKNAGPTYNITLIGIISLVGAFVFDYDDCAHLINFGAYLAFILVNASVINEYYFKAEKKTVKGFLTDFLAPAVGIVACLFIWKSLPRLTLTAGGSWVVVGVIFLALRTKGFREPIKVADIDAEST
jgi:amino acid transporter